LLSTFAASSDGYPESFIALIVITPVDITLPGPEPDNAPIKAEETTAAYPAPPGILPSKANIKFTEPSISFVFVMIPDIQVKTTIEYSSDFESPASIYSKTFPHVPVAATKIKKDAPIDSHMGLFSKMNHMQMTTNITKR
jgi:hypothetical protein